MLGDERDISFPREQHMHISSRLSAFHGGYPDLGFTVAHRNVRGQA